MSTEKGNQAYYDPSLVDKGWENMRRILDKEMPQQKRRIFFWLPLLAGLVAIIAVVFLLSTDAESNPAEREVVPVHEQPTEVMQPGQDPDLNVRPSDADETKLDRASIDHDPIQEVEARATGDLASTSQAQSIAAENQQTVSGKTQLQELEATDNLPITDLAINNSMADHQGNPLPENTMLNQVEMGNEEDIEAIDHEAQGKETREGLTMTTLTPLPSSYRIMELTPAWIYPIGGYIPVAVSDQKIEKRSNQIKFSFGINAGLLSDHRLKDFSWNIGPDARIRISPFFAVGTGLYYWQIKSDRFFLSQTLSTATDEAKDFTLQDPSQMADIERMGTNVSTGSSDLRLAGQTENLRYFRVPLAIHLFPDAAWRPHMGISQLFLMNSSPQQSELSALDQPNSNLQISPVSDFVRRRNLVYEFGLSFHPTSHLMFDMTFGVENKSYLNYEVSGPGFTELHRYWRISAGYRF